MQSAQSGADWETHMKKELEAQGYEEVSSSQPKTSASALGNRAGSNADRWRRLLEGNKFHCGESAGYGKAALRGAAYVLIPQHADFSTVWIQCNLQQEGVRHPEACSANLHDSDPAGRLGIRVRYTTRDTGVERQIWYKVNTDSDIKKLNSLIDFLDRKDEKYAASQKRRHLPLRKGKNGRPAFYT